MRQVRLVVVSFLVIMGAAAGWAQEKTPQRQPAAGKGQKAAKTGQKAAGDTLTEEESAELRQATGTESNVRSWSEFVADWMTPKPFPKKQVLKIDEEYAYPHLAASIKMKIVREDDENVWLVGISPEDPNSPLYKIWARREADEALRLDQADLMNTPGAVNFVDFAAEEVPPPFMESVLFEAVAEGLPTDGRWQMNFAVADLNEDGHPDLVFPPRRKGYPVIPIVFTGDGTGAFKPWTDVMWSDKVAWDYGGVAAGDFNGDGHVDLAFAIHFKAQYVVYGNGSGDFRRAELLPSPDPRLTSRAVTAADFDADGRLDLAFVAEVDYDVTSNDKIEEAPTVWALLNRPTGWEMSHKGMITNLIADVVRTADLDGDGRPELVVSANTLGIRHLVYSLNEDGTWSAREHRGFLSAAYHYDVEPGDGGLYATFVQFRRWHNRTEARNGLVRYPSPEGAEEFVIGQPLVWDKERDDVFFRLAVGDIDGDGLTDLATARRGGGLEIYLQTASGDFVKEKAPELASVGRAFDLRLVDLDGDGRDDLVAGCAPQGDLPGGVFVWLTRPEA